MFNILMCDDELVIHTLEGYATSLYETNPYHPLLLEGVTREGVISYHQLLEYRDEEMIARGLREQIAAGNVYNVRYPEDGNVVSGGIAYQVGKISPAFVEEYETYHQDGPSFQVIGQAPQVRELLQPIYEREALVRENDTLTWLRGSEEFQALRRQEKFERLQREAEVLARYDSRQLSHKRQRS